MQNINCNEVTQSYQNFETYKQLKNAAKMSNPDISKEKIYEQLLKPFRQEKVKLWDAAQKRFRVSYICKYEGCDKEFTKTWNLLDHVRMHEGIKPFTCNLCSKTFTQKGNLKKHYIVQHSSESLEERKKFRCEVWGKGYTERYNLVVRFLIYSLDSSIIFVLDLFLIFWLMIQSRKNYKFNIVSYEKALNKADKEKLNLIMFLRKFNDNFILNKFKHFLYY